MTARALLEQLRSRGITVIPRGDRLAVRPAAQLTDIERALVRQLKPELLELVSGPSPSDPASHVQELRSAYRAAFSMAVDEVDRQPIRPDAAQDVHRRIIRWVDEVGVLYADAIFADELRLFQRDSGRCGLCGNLGHRRDGPH